MTGRQLSIGGLVLLVAVIAFLASSTLAHPLRHVTPPPRPAPRLTEHGVASGTAAAVAELPRISLPAARRPPVKPKTQASPDGADRNPPPSSGAAANRTPNTGSPFPNTGGSGAKTTTKKKTLPKFQKTPTPGEYE